MQIGAFKSAAKLPASRIFLWSSEYEALITEIIILRKLRALFVAQTQHFNSNNTIQSTVDHVSMDVLPLEIIAHIGSLADLRSTAHLRSTCRAYLAAINNKNIILYNIHEENAHTMLRQLRPLKQISIGFRNLPKKSIDDPRPIFDAMNMLDIYSLNIKDFIYIEALTRCSHLNNTLESLEINNAKKNTLDSLTNLRRLVLWNSSPQLSKLTRLENLQLNSSDYTKGIIASNLTKLVVKHAYNIVRRLFDVEKDTLTNLKSLAVFDPFSMVPCLPTLESLVTDGRIDTAGVSLMTNLTRLELSGACFGREEDPHDLSSWSQLTKLQVLRIKDTTNRLVKSIAFISKLPLVSATISGVTRDDAECIQHLKPRLIRELCVDINNSSMFKHELTRLNHLHALTVRSSTPVVVEGIDTLTLLTRLVLVKSQCKSIERLTQLKALHADLTAAPMSGWTALTNLHQLEATVHSGSVPTLAHMTNLHDLVLSFAEPFESNHLSALTNLTRIVLPGLNYPSLDWLAPLTRLEHLDLRLSPITARDLDPLTKLGNLTTLSIQNAFKYRKDLTVLSNIFS